jgi:thioredoxin-like negative regulator of GroEL
MLEQLNKESFDTKVLDSTEKVGVLFHAEWAMPSVHQFINMEQFPVYHVDMEETPEVGAILNIRALPVIYVFEKGEIKSFKVGYMDVSEIQKYLQQEGIVAT